MKTFKYVCWSYPSSVNAAKFGHSKTGCYTVGYRDSDYNYTPQRGFVDEQEAVEFAKSLPGEWCPAFLRHTTVKLSEPAPVSAG